jgi:hypothetical protein
VVKSDFFGGELQLQSQGIREPVGQIGQADEQVEIHNLLIGEVLLDRGNIGIADLPWRARELLSEGERDFGLRAELSCLRIF